jgi:hypothetical protein
MHLRSLAFFSALGALSLAGCDMLTATTFAAGALTRTPDLSNTSEVVGLNADLVTAFGGASQLPGGTVALVALADRGSITSTNVTPVTGANVTVNYTLGGTAHGPYTLCPITSSGLEGTYETTSMTIAGQSCVTAIDYVEGAAYIFSMSTASDSYSMRTTAPAALSTGAVVFSTPLVASSIAGVFPGTEKLVLTGTNDLTITWGSSTDNVFVAVFRMNYVGTSWPTDATTQASWQLPSQNPVYNDLPKDAGGLIDVITRNPPSSVVVPHATFTQAGFYLLTLTKATISTDTTNLSIGSGALAGKSIAFAFLVEP